MIGRGSVPIDAVFIGARSDYNGWVLYKQDWKLGNCYGSKEYASKPMYVVSPCFEG